VNKGERDMNTDSILGTVFSGQHYTFACTGLKGVKERTFASRDSANKYMYSLLAKYGLKVVKVYNDKHHKTYICNNDITFYIQRAY
jgi:hypothetical protein